MRSILLLVFGSADYNYHPRPAHESLLVSLGRSQLSAPSEISRRCHVAVWRRQEITAEIE